MKESREDAEIKWFRLCTRQLQRDFDQICYLFKTEMRRPLFEIKSSLTFWGQWDPLTRRMSISKELISSQPWDVVLEILKHEMAHQYVTEVMKSEDGHGPYFHEACARLNVAPWARKAEGEMKPPAEEKTTAQIEAAGDSRLMGRVHKLLALANSSNPNEAAAAMQKVQELYLKYNLEEITEKRDKDCQVRLIRFGRKRLERFHYLACSILSDFYFVDVIYGSLFDSEALTEYRTAEVLGTKQNVLMAEYVYHFLFQQAEQFWKHRRKEGGGSRSSFFLGVFSGFQEKLKEQKEAMVSTIQREGSSEQKNALAVLENDPVLDAFVRTRYPRLRRFYRENVLRDQTSFEAGREKGRDIVLHRPITHGASASGKLLPRKG